MIAHEPIALWVRKLAVNLLADLGYRSLDVPDADEAWAALAGDQAVDLVLSDIVLPGGTDGLSFAEEARRRHRDLKIILMSGYRSGSDRRGDDLLATDMVLLNKPFERNQFAKSLRDALDVPPSPAGAA